VLGNQSSECILQFELLVYRKKWVCTAVLVATRACGDIRRLTLYMSVYVGMSLPSYMALSIVRLTVFVRFPVLGIRGLQRVARMHMCTLIWKLEHLIDGRNWGSIGLSLCRG
jgi:hypothetical protein